MTGSFDALAGATAAAGAAKQALHDTAMMLHKGAFSTILAGFWDPRRQQAGCCAEDLTKAAETSIRPAQYPLLEEGPDFVRCLASHVTNFLTFQERVQQSSALRLQHRQSVVESM